VIADELHKLANHSKTAAAQVGTLVGEVLRETEAVTEDTRDATAGAEASIRRASETTDAFARVVGEIGKTSAAVAEIGSIAREQAVRAAQVEDAAMRLNAVSVASGEAMHRVVESSDAIARSAGAAREVATAVVASAAFQRSVHANVIASVGHIDAAGRASS